MAMTRTDAAVHLHLTYSALESRLTCFSGPDGYGTVINSALRDLGFAESDLATAVVPDEDVSGYLALLDYYALRKFLQAAVVLTNTTIDGVPINRGQIVENIKFLLTDATNRAVSGGWLTPPEVVPVIEMELGAINLDYLEPGLEF
jgi:hypothetical protein